MGDINKDEAERQKREAEQAAAAASARAAQADAEASRLRAIVEGIAALPTMANNIMAAIQSARVQVETDAHQASAVLADLKAAKDKAAAILNECRGHEAAARDAAAEAVTAKLAADDVKSAFTAAQGDSLDVRDLCAKAQDAMSIIDNLRAKAERDAKSEKVKSWLGIILAGLALIVAIGAVVAFYHFSHIHPTADSQSQGNLPAAAALAQPGQAPAPVVQPPVTPAPFTLASSLGADKSDFMKYCLGNGLTSDECEAAWKRYTE